MFAKKTFCVVLFCLYIASTNAQTNLVPNPSFEDTVQCPDYLGELYYATPWHDATGSSPEYFHACTDSVYVDVPLNYWGTQSARTGNAYAGFGCAFDFIVDGREYPQVQLTSTLSAGVTYDVEFFVSLSDISSCASSSIGLYFSDTAITGPNGEVLNVIPQIVNPVGNFLTDTLGWMQISGTYIATGTENFITIGNFQTDANSDSISVGQHVYQGAYYYLDDVSVVASVKNTIPEESTKNNPQISIYPNPTNGSFTVTSNSKGTLSVCNVLGDVVYESTLSVPKSEIDLTGMGSGVYFLSVQSEQGVVTEKVVIR